MKKQILAFLFFGMFLISFVSAVQTINIQEQDVGITIEYPKFTTIKQNEPFNLRFHAFNSTDGKVLTNETTNCTFNIYNHTGDNVLRMIPTFDNLGEGDCSHCFAANILKGNFTEIDEYSYLIRCEAESEGGAISAGFEVTYNGKENPEGIVIVIYTLLFILIFAFAIIYFFIALEHFMSLEMDLRDATLLIVSYLSVFIFYYFSVEYLANPVVNNLLEIALSIGALSHVILPLIAFLISFIITNFQFKQKAQVTY